jgi:hypothetical protein
MEVVGNRMPREHVENIDEVFDLDHRGAVKNAKKIRYKMASIAFMFDL